jgi:hypothetical protein
MRQIVLPYLAELGDRWELGNASIAQAHFASNLIRSGWPGWYAAGATGAARGPSWPARPEEWHDLALMIFGVTLNRHWWRIDYLGVDTPVEEHRWSAACCRPFMTARSPAGGRLHLLAAPVLARPQEPRAALVQQLTHPAPPRSRTASRDSKGPV